MSSLFLLAEEISHSDLVYTFFHPLLKDEEETNIHIHKHRDSAAGEGGSSGGHERKSSAGKIRGRIKLKIYYRAETLHVLIQFVENLSVNDAREEPNSYVKVVLTIIFNMSLSFFSLSLSLSIYIYISLSPSLSLYIYIYLYLSLSIYLPC